MGCYGETTGTFLGYRIPEFEFDPLISSDFFEDGYNGFVYCVWDHFVKTQKHYNLKSSLISSFVGLKLHRCGYEPETRKPSTNLTYIGLYIAENLDIKQLPDKSYKTHFDFTFPPNICEIATDFWIFLNEKLRKIDEKCNKDNKKKVKSETSETDESDSEDDGIEREQEEEAKGGYEEYDYKEDLIKKIDPKELELMRNKILPKIHKEPRTVQTVSWG